jgi:hypothetical protein
MKRGGAEHAEEDAKENEAEDRLPACDGKWASSLFLGRGAVPELRRQQPGRPLSMTARMAILP